jgi:hypothetical protein
MVQMDDCKPRKESTRFERYPLTLPLQVVTSGSSRASCLQVHNVRRQDNMNQYSVLKGLVEADLSNKTGAIACDTVPGTDIPPSWFMCTNACRQPGALLGDYAAIDYLALHFCRGGTKELGCCIVDRDNPTARGFK